MYAIRSYYAIVAQKKSPQYHLAIFAPHPNQPALQGKKLLKQVKLTTTIPLLLVTFDDLN